MRVQRRHGRVRGAGWPDQTGSSSHSGERGSGAETLPNPHPSVAEPERLDGFHRLADAGAHLVGVHHRRERDFRAKAHKEEAPGVIVGDLGALTGSGFGV
jgi:hypothetical protein